MASASSVAELSPEQTEQAPHQSADAVKFGWHVAHISRQSSVFLAGAMFTAAAGYLFRVYLARKLGAEALGIYALGMTIVNVLAIFNCLGLPQAAVRFVASYSATGQWEHLGRLLGRSCTLLLLCNIPIIAVMLTAGPWFTVHFYHAPALVPYLWLFVLIMLMGDFTTFSSQVLTGYREVSRRTIITNFIGIPLTMLLTIGFLLLGTGLWGYIVAQVAASAVVLLLLGRAVWKLTPKRAQGAISARPRLPREVVSFSAVSLGVALLELLMSQSDKVFIGLYLSARDVGVYATAMALVGFVPMVLQSVNQIFAPVIADLHARGEHELLERLFQTVTKWTVGLTLPLGVVVVIFSRPLMGIFGPDFEVGGPILVIGTLGQIINCATGSVGYLLLMSGNQQRLIRVQALIAGMTVVLSFALIPRWGMIGAAVVSAVTGVVCNLLCLRESGKALSLSPYNRGYVRLIPPLLSVIAVSLLLRGSLPPNHSAVLTIGCAGVLGYVVFLGVIAVFGLTTDDRLVMGVLIEGLKARPDGRRNRNAFFVTHITPEEISTQ